MNPGATYTNLSQIGVKLCGEWFEPMIKSHQCGFGKFHMTRPRGLNKMELSPNPKTTRRFRTQLNLRSNVGLENNVPEKQKPEPNPSQAGRPRRGRLGSNCHCWGYATSIDYKRRSRASTKRRWPGGHIPRPAGLGEAGRPHLEASWAGSWCESKAQPSHLLSTDAICNTGREPTLEDYK